jgi:probable HAF family extracellular repeat protein
MLGASAGSATAINNAGEVVGQSSGLAFLYNGTMQILGTLPGQTASIAYGINNSGEIVGSNNSGSQAFLYDGTMQPFSRSARCPGIQIPKPWESTIQET